MISLAEGWKFVTQGYKFPHNMTLTCLETKAHMGDSRIEGGVRLRNTLHEKQLKKTWEPDQLYPMWPGQRVELSENRSDLI